MRNLVYEKTYFCVILCLGVVRLCCPEKNGIKNLMGTSFQPVKPLFWAQSDRFYGPVFDGFALMESKSREELVVNSNKQLIRV